MFRTDAFTTGIPAVDYNGNRPTSIASCKTPIAMFPTRATFIFFRQTRRFLVNLPNVKKVKYHIDIQIDRITNSILNTVSGDSFQTEVLPVKKDDLKGITKKAGWKFNWKTEANFEDRQVYKLTIEGNRNIVQGLISMTDMHDHMFSG